MTQGLDFKREIPQDFGLAQIRTLRRQLVSFQSWIHEKVTFFEALPQGTFLLNREQIEN